MTVPVTIKQEKRTRESRPPIVDVWSANASRPASGDGTARQLDAKRPNRTSDFLAHSPEVRIWEVCCRQILNQPKVPRSRFLGSFTDHFDGLPTWTKPLARRTLRVPLVRGYAPNEPCARTR